MDRAEAERLIAMADGIAHKRRARHNSLSAASKQYKGNRRERRKQARGGAIGIQS